MGTVDLWREMRKSFDLLARYPQILLATFPSAFLVSVANFLVWDRRFSRITLLFQWGGGMLLVLSGFFLALLALGFITFLLWDLEVRGEIRFRRALFMFSKRFHEILFAALVVGFLVGFFSFWFVFPGLVFGFLLMFTIPAVVVEGDDPFSAIRRSFHLTMENLGECFTFTVLALFLLVMGYLLFWVFGFASLAGIALNTLLGGGILAYLSVLLGRFYFGLSRF
ncbi:MAG: hypothetical protein H5U36_08735 [Candidatus Caldatribacterium sp.]|nr:hypothetical protein [Candidatus Caldatribacterium sp.]